MQSAPPDWKCPDGCPYQQSHAWAAVKITAYMVVIAVAATIAAKGDELEADAKAALYAMGTGAAGVAVDAKKFRDDALSLAIKQLLARKSGKAGQ